MDKTIAYLRVSTDEQDLENQRLEITKYAHRKQLQIDDWIHVEISSRKNTKVRRIDELFKLMKRGDRLIVSELSRLARSIREAHAIIEDMIKKKVEVHLIKQNIVARENDMNTTVLINAFAMAAQIERDLISQRTKNGMALAKKNGKQIGNPNLKADNAIRIQRANAFAEGLRGVVTALVNNGLTQMEIVEELNKSGVRTAMGCEWKLQSLQRVLKRLELRTITYGNN